jgi:hypothetical protein
VTRPHEDIDLIFPRDQQELRLAQLAELGFTGWETWGEAAPGVPFYLFGQNGHLKIDLGITDEADGKIWMRVHRLPSRLAVKKRQPATSCGSPTTSSTIQRPSSTGSRSSPISPLAMYQIRAGVAQRNSFGPLSERHRATLAQLRERFFPDRAEEELLPPSEPLPN